MESVYLSPSAPMDSGLMCARWRKWCSKTKSVRAWSADVHAVSSVWWHLLLNTSESGYSYKYNIILWHVSTLISNLNMMCYFWLYKYLKIMKRYVICLMEICFVSVMLGVYPGSMQCTSALHYRPLSMQIYRCLGDNINKYLLHCKCYVFTICP